MSSHQESVVAISEQRVAVHKIEDQSSQIGQSTSAAELHQQQDQRQQRFQLLHDTTAIHYGQQQQQQQHANFHLVQNQFHQFHHQMQHVTQQHHQQQQQQQYSIQLGDGSASQNNSQTNSIDPSTFDEDLSPYWSDSTLSNCDNNNKFLNKHSDSTTKAQVKKSPNKRQTTANKSPKLVRGNNSNDNNNNNDNDNQACNNIIACTTNGGGTGVKRKRHMANERERERTKSLNEALEKLRNRLPVPEAEKRSKIQTLRTAKEYIEFLAKLRRSAQESAECDSSSQELSQYHNNKPAPPPPPPQFLTTLTNPTNDQSTNQHHPAGNNNIDSTNQLPDSPLTYKFYKFRHSQKLKR